VTYYASATFIPECVPLTCGLCYAFNHNYNSRPHYVRLKVEIENTIKIAFNLMEHMIDEKISESIRN